MSINHVVVSGNLTREPELRTTASGLSVLNFGLAVDDRKKNKDTGEWEDAPNFVECVVFGAFADVVIQNVGKGKHVVVEGKLRQDRWEDKNGGGKRSKISIVVDTLEWDRVRNSVDGSSADALPADVPVVDTPPMAYEDIPF